MKYPKTPFDPMLLLPPPAYYNGKAVKNDFMIIENSDRENSNGKNISRSNYQAMLSMDLEHQRFASFFYSAEEKRMIDRRKKHLRNFKNRNQEIFK